MSGTQTQHKVQKLTPLKEYLFRVRAVNGEGESPNLETKVPVLAKNPYDEPSAPSTPEIVNWNSVSIFVHFEGEKNNKIGASIFYQ